MIKLVLLFLMACASKVKVPEAQAPIKFYVLNGEEGMLMGEDPDGSEDHSSITCGVAQGCWCVEESSYQALQHLIIDLQETLRDCQKNR